MLRLTVYSLVLLICGCAKPSLSDDEASLMKIHDQAREFHFLKNAKGMVDGFADNFISANRGKLDTVLSRQEDSTRFQRYFDAVRFKKWDDLTPPIIRFSDDHTLAYMTVNKIVVLETQDSIGNPVESTTHFVWVSIFENKKAVIGNWSALRQRMNPK